MTEEIRSPVCPMCSQPTNLIVSIEQAFCETVGCPVLCWDMRITPEEFRRQAVGVRLDVELEGHPRFWPAADLN